MNSSTDRDRYDSVDQLKMDKLTGNSQRQIPNQCPTRSQQSLVRRHWKMVALDPEDSSNHGHTQETKYQSEYSNSGQF